MSERRRIEAAEPAGTGFPAGTEPEPVRSEVVTFPSRGVAPAVGVPILGTRISWGAIFAGAVVALVTQLLLTLLGLSIGLGLIGPAQGQEGFAGIGIGAGIWWSVSALVSLFAGGWVAGRLAGVPRSMAGFLHGVVTWGFVTVLSIYLMTTAVGSLVAGGLGLAGQGLEMAGRGGAGVPPAGQIQERIQEGAQEARESAERVLPQATGPAAWGAFAAFAALLLGGISAAVGGWAGAPRSMPPVVPPTAGRR